MQLFVYCSVVCTRSGSIFRVSCLSQGAAQHRQLSRVCVEFLGPNPKQIYGNAGSSMHGNAGSHFHGRFVANVASSSSCSWSDQNYCVLTAFCLIWEEAHTALTHVAQLLAGAIYPSVALSSPR